MVEKILNLLNYEELSLEIRKVMVSNYFAKICSSKMTIDQIKSKKMHPEIKAHIINYYSKPIYITDYDLREKIKIEEVFMKIVSEPNKHAPIVVKSAISALSAYGNKYIIDNLEEFVSLTKENITAYYGPLTEYLIDLVSLNPHFIISISSKLFDLTFKNKYHNIPLKLLLDLIYKHYRFHPSFSKNDDFNKLVENLRESHRIDNVKDLFKLFVQSTNITGACLFDININLNTYLFNKGYDDHYKFKQQALTLDSDSPLYLSISDTSPILVKKSYTEKGSSFFDHYSVPVENILLVPCLYFGEVNSILVVLLDKPLSIETYVLSFVFAKYIAGVISKYKEDLNIQHLNDRFSNDTSIVMKAFNHDITPPIQTINNLVLAMQNDAEVKEFAKKNIERLDICNKSCEVVSEYIKNIVTLYEQVAEPENINLLMEKTVKVLSYYFKRDKINVQCSYDDKCPKIKSPPGLIRVFQNIILNAVEALQYAIDKKSIQINTNYYGQHKMICVSIIDNGPGIDKSIKDKLKRSFEEKPVNYLDGMGLFIAYDTVIKMGGSIEIPLYNNGAQFDIYLPIER